MTDDAIRKTLDQVHAAQQANDIEGMLAAPPVEAEWRAAYLINPGKLG